MRVREFWLTNSNGDKYDLMEKKSFAHSPDGLGYEVELTTTKLGNTDLILSEQYKLTPFTCDLLFIGQRNEVYQNYREFLDFLALKPILLHYRTPNTNESYRCNARVISVSKTEVSEDDRILHIPIQIYRQGMWYSDEENIIDAGDETQAGKEYPLERPYHYGMTDIANINLYNGGMVDAPLKIEIFGTTTDMEFSLYDSTNEKYGAGRILGTYDYIMINTDDTEEEIVLRKNGADVDNAINYQDNSVGVPQEVKATFVQLKTGQSKLVLNLDNDFSGFARISWRNAYVSV